MATIADVCRIRDTLILTIGSNRSLLGMTLYVNYSVKYNLYHYIPLGVPSCVTSSFLLCVF